MSFTQIKTLFEEEDSISSIALVPNRMLYTLQNRPGIRQFEYKTKDRSLFHPDSRGLLLSTHKTSYPNSYPTRTSYSLSNKGVTITDLDSGKKRMIPLRSPSAVAADPVRGFLFYANPEGIYRMQPYFDNGRSTNG